MVIFCVFTYFDSCSEKLLEAHRTFAVKSKVPFTAVKHFNHVLSHDNE